MSCSKVGGSLPLRTVPSAASGTASATTRAAAKTTLDPLRMPGVIGTPELAENGADLADGTAGAQGLPHRWKEVLVGLRDAPDLGQRGGRGARVAVGADARGAVALPPLDLGIDLE